MKTNYKKTKRSKAQRQQRSRATKHFKELGGYQGLKRKLASLGYPPQYTYKLRRKVRTRDGFRCCRCGKTEAAEIRTTDNLCLNVHHIDQDKCNNDMGNLITLCRDCHDYHVHGRGKDSEEVRGWIVTSPLYERREGHCEGEPPGTHWN